MTVDVNSLVRSATASTSVEGATITRAEARAALDQAGGPTHEAEVIDALVAVGHMSRPQAEALVRGEAAVSSSSTGTTAPTQGGTATPTLDAPGGAPRGVVTDGPLTMESVSGRDVRNTAANLAGLGYDVARGMTGEHDFDSVRDFQVRYGGSHPGMTPTGMPDTATRAALQAEVRGAQEGLAALGYNVGRGGPDGIYGNDTAAATRAFQTANGLEPTGILDADTRRAISESRSGNIPALENNPVFPGALFSGHEAEVAQAYNAAARGETPPMEFFEDVRSPSNHAFQPVFEATAGNPPTIRPGVLVDGVDMPNDLFNSVMRNEPDAMAAMQNWVRDHGAEFNPPITEADVNARATEFYGVLHGNHDLTYPEGVTPGRWHDNSPAVLMGSRT